MWKKLSLMLSPRSSRGRRPRVFRPGVEGLEGRLVPAAFAVGVHLPDGVVSPPEAIAPNTVLDAARRDRPSDLGANFFGGIFRKVKKAPAVVRMAATPPSASAEASTPPPYAVEL